MNVREEANKFKEDTGVEIPSPLIELYEANGNGGFGPDYGMIGIINGHKTDLDDSILTLYKSFIQPDPDDPGWNWPKELIPFIHIGCGIHFCIDTSNPEFRVIEFDPNGYGPGEILKKHFKVIYNSFNQWVKENIK